MLIAIFIHSKSLSVKFPDEIPVQTGTSGIVPTSVAEFKSDEAELV